NVGDFFALDVDDPAAVAGEDGDVGAFAFTGTVDDTAHHRNFDRQRNLGRKLFANVLHQLEEINLNSPARRAGNQLGADALAQAEHVKHLQAILDFELRIGRIADANRVADAAAQQMSKWNDG